MSHDKSVGVLKFDNNLDRFKSLEPLTSESSATTFNTPAPPRSSKKKLNFSSGEQVCKWWNEGYISLQFYVDFSILVFQAKDLFEVFLGQNFFITINKDHTEFH